MVTNSEGLKADTNEEFKKKLEKYKDFIENYKDYPVVGEYVSAYGFDNFFEVLKYISNPIKQKKYEKIVIENDIRWYDFLLYSLPMGGFISKIFKFFINSLKKIAKFIKRLLIGDIIYDKSDTQDEVGDVDIKAKNTYDGESLNIIVQKYYLGEVITEIIRVFVYVLSQIRDLFDYQGTTLEIANSIRVSSICGIFSSIALFVIMILAFFLHSMYGIQFVN
jgi:hypothetical protein